MRFEATITTDAFHHGICLGQLELRCYNIDQQEPKEEARIDERASLVVSFIIPDAAPLPLRGLIDTGSGVSIQSCSHWCSNATIWCGSVRSQRENRQDLWSG